jgi:capsular exopolysaccharide synthesis family protein
MVAANLACTLARRTQEKTLLLDGDLRRPTLTQLFGVGRIPGISEWLYGEQRQISNIYHLAAAGLWLLPAGAVPINPLELLQSQRLSMLLEQLTACFHWIVIDSPPVLPLADTSVWMRIADGILLVSRQGVTKKEQLKRGLAAIERTKLLGALLNGSTNTNDDAYYQYYGSSSERTLNTDKSNA